MDTEYPGEWWLEKRPFPQKPHSHENHDAGETDTTNRENAEVIDVTLAFGDQREPHAPEVPMKVSRGKPF
ncbi:MAG: hypothetical protein AB1646_23780 [Thermodesulfobacteriota bacterium]